MAARRLDTVEQHLSSAAHRQTKYVAAPPLPGLQALPLPPPTPSVEQAKRDLSTHGLAVLTGALSPDLLRRLRGKLDRQAQAEAKAFGSRQGKNNLSSLVNKGAVFLELVEHPAVDELAGYLFGRHFLLHSLTGSYFNAPELTPQVLHRDQGQVPATADFPAASVFFWCLDDFTPEDGGTYVVPGSHRWPPEHLVKPPPRALAQQITAPAGSLFCWDGRVWHGAGGNRTGAPRRAVSTFWCLPWIRQQENWGVTTLQEVIEGASKKTRARLGLLSYGTLGTFGGAAPPAPGKGKRRDGGLGNALVDMPDAIVGEDAVLHPYRRPTRRLVGRAE